MINVNMIASMLCVVVSFALLIDAIQFPEEYLGDTGLIRMAIALFSGIFCLHNLNIL